jgi:hypothetical protein
MHTKIIGCKLRWKFAILIQSLILSGCLTGSTSGGVNATISSLPDLSATLAYLSVTPDTSVLLLGRTMQYAATGLLNDGATVTLGAPTWLSSAPGVVSINSSGLATALTLGSTVITAAGGGSTATATINVGQLLAGTVQGVPLNISGAVTTFAGSGVSGNANSLTDILATFNSPAGITTDGTNLYVLDSNYQIRKIVIATGEVTLLGAGALVYGSNITNDGINIYATVNYSASSGNLNFSEISKINIATGAGIIMAGSSTRGAADSTVGTTATFNNPAGITTDGTNLYVADSGNNKIRQIVIASGAVTTLAGSGVAGAADSATGPAATFNNPTQITTDGIYLYVADNINIIRTIKIATGAVSTMAATLSANKQISGITTDGSKLYASFGASEILQIEIATGTVMTLAGSTSQGAVDSVTGSEASFNNPMSLTNNGSYLYVADKVNNKIRLIQ